MREVTSIYDGDTFRVTIEGWPPALGERMPVRIKGIDAPELRGRCLREKQMARVAKQYTVDELRKAHRIELRISSETSISDYWPTFMSMTKISERCC